MARWLLALSLAAGAALGAVAGSAGPSVPKDTLPAMLAVNATPAGLDPKLPVPEDNPLTEAKIELGRKLFFDPILSKDRSVACASCHDPNHGFASKEPKALGIGGKRGRRNAPSLLNRAFGTSQFWDGRATSLEEQALKPIDNETELGSSVAETLQRLRNDAAYRDLFTKAFPDGVTAQNLARAIASFERVLLSGNSRIDRFIATEVTTLDAGERHGLWLFQSRGQCWRCHSGGNFSDERFHNTGVSWGQEPLDLGRYEVTKKDEDRGRFKTPTLRGVANTPPYMHDGSLATLEDVIEFYSKGGGKNPHLDAVMQPLELKAEDKRDLVAFLKALTGEPAK
jgi:cytochrome c peroxidase